MFLKSTFVRWRVMRRCRRADRDFVEVFRQLDDHLLKDIGLKRPRSAGDPWL